MLTQVPTELESTYIGGQWTKKSNDHIVVCNPATQERIGQIPNCGKTETLKAISSAQTAFAHWSSLTSQRRADLLLSLHKKLLEQSDWLASLITLENGKPLREAMAEVKYATAYVRWYAEQARRIDGDIIGSGADSIRMLVMRRPVGVVALITPWNFPLAMITRKLSAALAAGCTAVIKPSELTPFSTIALAKLIEEAGFPAGSVNVVCGAPQPIGEVFCQNEIIRKLSFTGSTRIGKHLLAQASVDIKRCSMELVGMRHSFSSRTLILIQLLMACWLKCNSGPTCIAANGFWSIPQYKT